MSLNHPTIGEKQEDDPISSPYLSYTPKALLVLLIFIHSI